MLERARDKENKNLGVGFQIDVEQLCSLSSNFLSEIITFIQTKVDAIIGNLTWNTLGT